MSTTKIMKCECQHQYQDHKYGKNQRVHNQKISPNMNEYTCTVCKKVNKDK